MSDDQREREAEAIRQMDESGNPRNWKTATEDRADLRQKLIFDDGMSEAEADQWLKEHIED